MSIDDETLLEMMKEEDLNDLSLLEKMARKIVLSGDIDNIGFFLRKLHFPFLANGEGYRTRVLETLENLLTNISLNELFLSCSDTLVGNYVIIFALLKRHALITSELAKTIADIVPKLRFINDVYLFGFPYQEQVLLEIDERVKTLEPQEIADFAVSCNILFGIGFFIKSRKTVESFQQIYAAIDKQDYTLRAQIIASLLNKDFGSFSLAMQRFGYDLKSEEQIISEYSELWRNLERLLLPVFYHDHKLRYNGVLFNDNFYFLLYMDLEGKIRVVYPFSQVPLSGVSKVFDPQARVFYIPKERYGRLHPRDIYSFREIENVRTADHDAITAIKSMSEDEIEDRIRLILKDANVTSHSPIELVDILTQKLYVNNLDDLRVSGFIIKGQSFGKVHLNSIAGQILKACQSRVDIVFLIHIPPIDDPALETFIVECESKQKNYCVIDHGDLGRLFVAYRVL